MYSIVADVMPSSFFPFALWSSYTISHICTHEFHGFLHYSNQKNSILLQWAGTDLKWMDKVITLSHLQCCVLQNGLFLRCN